jgi:cystathionine beta-lyase
VHSSGGRSLPRSQTPGGGSLPKAQVSGGGSLPSPAGPPATPDAPAQTLAEVIQATTVDDLRAGGSMKWTMPGEGELGAFVAEMDFGTAPAVTAAVHRCLADAAFGYLPPWLHAEFGEAVAQWQLERHGWQVDPENVHAVGDVLSVLRIVIDHFSRPGSPVILPTPAYHPFFQVPPTCRRETIEVPCPSQDGRYRLDLDGIDRAFAAGGHLLVLCNPHNPVGRMLSRDELTALAEVVDARGGRVFADEVHAPIVYPDSPPHVPYASLSAVTAGHTVTGTSASKAFNVPGLKCAAAIVSNEADARAWSAMPEVVTHGASTPGVAANIAAYRDGGPWLAEVLDYLAGNRSMLVRWVADRLPEVRFRPPEGSYLSWLDLRRFALPSAPAQFLRDRAGVWVNDGADFGAPGFVRLNMATPRPVLSEVLDRIAGALEGMPMQDGTARTR